MIKKFALLILTLQLVTIIESYRILQGAFFENPVFGNLPQKRSLSLMNSRILGHCSARRRRNRSRKRNR